MVHSTAMKLIHIHNVLYLRTCLIEMSTTLKELAVNERNSTTLTLTEPYATVREGRENLFIISTDKNRKKKFISHFKALLEINKIKSNIVCNSPYKQINMRQQGRFQ